MASETDLLAQEYLHLQKVIEDFDGKALTVKAWSVTFSAAAIGFAYSHHASALLIVSAVSALTFWVVEALVKTNQQAYYRRIYEIEAHFAGKATYRPFQIAAAWGSGFREAGRYGNAHKTMLWPHVLMPHPVIAALAIILLLADAPQPAGKSTPASASVNRTARPATPPAARAPDVSTPRR